MDDLEQKLKQYTPLHFSSPSRKSSVGIIISKQKHMNMIILTKRNSNLSNHAGEISFPGGTYDAEDGDLFTTCVREIKEELNLDLNRNHCIGQLDDVWTLTGYLIRPFVFIENNVVVNQFNKDEIESVLEVPTSFIASNKNHQIKYYKNRLWNSYTYNFKGHNIWGATANILNTLASL